MIRDNYYNLLDLFDKFIRDSVSGRRLQRNGKRLRKETIQNYRYLQRLLIDFSVRKEFPLRIRNAVKLSKKEYAMERKYWKRFYREFTGYLYRDLDCFDNYVGSNMRMIRAFFNYLAIDLGLQIGTFHKNFYIAKEEIPIVVLSPEQLNFLIFDKVFESLLPEHLRKTKDIFVFGCTVALRVSDLMQLKLYNLEIIDEHYYLKVISKKTQSQTRIRLPEHAIEIINRYRGKQRTLLPQISLFNLNNNIRQLMETAGWTDPCIKSRSKQGKIITIPKNSSPGQAYRFCDLVSSHTMRRTAITTMLRLGMPEHLVRKISGHSAGSKEFFRYVALSQLYIDSETEIMFNKFHQKSMSGIQKIA